jgi:8-oxo-dGTP diphosphatase
MTDPAMTQPITQRPLRVVALALIRDRRVLMVVARGRDVLYLPGGKIDAGESARAALVRECREELGVGLDETTVEDMFTVLVQAHGEPDGRLVSMTVYRAETPDEPRPSGEIDSLHWVTSADADRCPPAGVDTLERLRDLDLID